MNCEYTNFINCVKDRFEKVSLRLNALELERELLVREHNTLEDLLSTYNQREYDSITEERNVTTHFMGEDGLKNSKHVRSENFKKGIVKQTVITILKKATEKLTASQILQQARTTIGRDVTNGGINITLKRLIDKGLVKKTIDSKYYWEVG